MAFLLRPPGSRLVACKGRIVCTERGALWPAGQAACPLQDRTMADGAWLEVVTVALSELERVGG